MSAKGFTPGPWAADRDRRIAGYGVTHSGEPNPVAIACVKPRSKYTKGISDSVALANARLIASAPALLEALTLAASKPLAQHCTDEEWEFIRSAILGAQGEQV